MYEEGSDRVPMSERDLPGLGEGRSQAVDSLEERQCLTLGEHGGFQVPRGWPLTVGIPPAVSERGKPTNL